jgi:tetratricopeptide (TPR) repeat protein
MLMLCLLAWRRLPAWAVAGLSLIAVGGWYWIGARALWALVPAAAFVCLTLHERLKEPWWMKALPIAAAAVLMAWATADYEADRDRGNRYLRTWLDGDRLALAGKEDEAAEAYRQADRLRPRRIGLGYMAVGHMMASAQGSGEQAARLFQSRMPRLMRELEDLIRRDPEWPEPRRDLVELLLLQGKIPEAVEHYRLLHHLRPQDPEITAVLDYLVLRAADADSRQLDLRRLARPVRSPGFAEIANDLAAWGKGYTVGERVRLLIEATQYNPDHLPAHQNLAKAYLGEEPALSPFRDVERAVWHAQRAVSIARSLGNVTDLAESLLLAGRALAAGGHSADARGALEEGRRLAPDELKTEFDRLLDRL